MSETATDTRDRCQRATERINRTSAKLAGCHDTELIELSNAAGITFDEFYFSGAFLNNPELLPHDTNGLKSYEGLKNFLRRITAYRRKYGQTRRGFYPLNAFKLAKEYGLPSPFWVEEWLHSGLADYATEENRGKDGFRLDDFLNLSPGKQGASTEWRKIETEEREETVLEYLSALVHGCGFDMATGRVIVGEKWDLSPDTVKEYQKRRAVFWGEMKNNTGNTAEELLHFLDTEMTPFYHIVFEDHEDNHLLTPSQRKKARRVISRLMEEERHHLEAAGITPPEDL
jgi:hypothetical protein